VELWGPERVTNYLHLLFAGHIRDELYRCKSLWKFQAQGWEALNSSIKQYIFKRTSRGGGGQSIATSLYRWSLRRLLIWLYPDLKELAELLEQQKAELKQEKEMEKQRKRNRLNDSDIDVINDRDANVADVVDEEQDDDLDFAIY
jgi:hypothetical protein